MVPLTRLAPVGLGFAFGLYFVLSSAYLHASLWPVWAPLVVAFTTAAGAVFIYGLDCWDELELFPLNEATEAAAILSLAEDRHKLEQLLGVDRGAIADLQT